VVPDLGILGVLILENSSIFYAGVFFGVICRELGIWLHKHFNSVKTSPPQPTTKQYATDLVDRMDHLIVFMERNNRQLGKVIEGLRQELQR